MGMRAVLIALGALALAGCASTDYGYAYCYDPYSGPVGYYTGPLEPKPACARQLAQGAVFVKHEGGYRQRALSVAGLRGGGRRGYSRSSSLIEVFERVRSSTVFMITAQ
jgi:hypothetical protein